MGPATSAGCGRTSPTTPQSSCGSCLISRYGPPDDLRDKFPRPHDRAFRIAIDRKLRRDHALRRDAVLHPLLERLEQAVLRVVTGTQPLTKIVRLLTAAAVPHSRNQIELQKSAN